MPSLFSGTSLGLFNSSISRQFSHLGQSRLGQNGDNNYLNVQSGNLVIQRQDAFLVGQGNDAQVLRTYNSRGDYSDDNGDNWRFNTISIRGHKSGSVNTQNHTITRTMADGSAQQFTYDTALGGYISAGGAGAKDRLTVSGGIVTFVDGDSGIREKYNSDGVLSQRIDTDGSITTFDYDGFDLVSVKTASGEVITIEYDSSGNPSAVITQEQINDQLTTTHIVRYTYDNHRLKTVTVDLSPEDNSVTDGHVFVTEYEYINSWDTKVTGIQHSDGSRVNYAYDDQGRISQIIDGHGKITTLQYDTEKYTTIVTSPEGIVTRYVHDADGNLVKLSRGPVNGQLLETTYSYDADGNTASITDASGRVTRFDYDSQGNNTTVTDSLGNRTVKTYDNNLLVTEKTFLEAGNETSAVVDHFIYDSERHLRFIINGEGEVIERRYFANGNLSDVIRYSGEHYPISNLASNTVLTESDLVNWLNNIDQSKGERASYRYDFRGQLVNTMTYDELDAEGNGVGDAYITTSVYDARGRMVKTITAKGNASAAQNDGVTLFHYDGLNRITSTVNVDGQTSVMLYDDANRRTIETSVTGLVTTTVYDHNGRMISTSESAKHKADGELTTFGETRYHYNDDGLLMGQTDPEGVVSYLFYDANNQVVAEVDGTGAVVEYRRLPTGEVRFKTHYALRIDTTSWYDSNTATITARLDDYLANKPEASPNHDRVTETQYDNKGRKQYESRGNDSFVEYVYDSRDRLIKKIAYANHEHKQNRIERFYYDDADRLVGTVDPEGYLTTRRFDEAGNLIRQQAYAAAVDETLLDKANLDELARSLTANTNDRIERFFYDARGQKILHVDAEKFVTQFTYDEEGQLVEKKQFANQLPEEPDFFSEEEQVLAQFSPNTGWPTFQNYPRIMGDVDGDGNDDIIGFSTDGVYVSLSSGNLFEPYSGRWHHQFGLRADWSFDRHPRAVADVNGDGMVDIIGFGGTGTYVSLSTGTGFTEFSRWNADFGFQEVNYFEGAPRWVADVNGDGLADLIGVKNQEVFVSLSDGKGFATAQQWGNADSNSSHSFGKYSEQPVFMGDVNNDGMADLVHVGVDAVYVRLSTGTGFGQYQHWGAESFAFRASDGSTRNQLSWPRQMADMDGDGMEDLVAFQPDGVYIAYSNGNGFEQAVKELIGFGSNTGGRDNWINNNNHPRLLGDFTGDGRADIIGFGKNGVYVSSKDKELPLTQDPYNPHFNDAEFVLAQFAPEAGRWTNFNMYPRVMGDVDGDGDDDVIGFGVSGTHVSLSNGNTFEPHTQWIQNYATHANGWASFEQFPRTVADVNGDGMDDIVGFASNGAVAVSLSTGTSFVGYDTWHRSFGHKPGTTFDTAPRWVADVNGDGMADLIGVKHNDIVVALSNGSSFGPEQKWANTDNDFNRHVFAHYDEQPAFIGDVNGDGMADMVHVGKDAVYVRLSTGKGFGAYQHWGAESFSFEDPDGRSRYQESEPRYLADVDGDGRDDLVAFKPDGVYVAYSYGRGFANPVRELTDFGSNTDGSDNWESNNDNPRILGDLTGDGQADIVGFGQDGVYIATRVNKTVDDSLADWQDFVPEASEADKTWTFAYDHAGRVTRSVDSMGVTTTHDYDVAGRLRHTRVGEDSPQGQRAVDQFIAYDERGLVTAKVAGGGASAMAADSDAATISAQAELTGENNRYDASGRLISTRDAINGTTWFYYDANGRVSHTVNALGEVIENTYNAFGEVATKRVYGKRISVAALTGGSLQDSNFASRLDVLADQSVDSYREYAYNTVGQVSKITEAIDAIPLLTTNGAGGLFRQFVSTEYEYDEFGDLIREKQILDRNNKRSRETQFTYDRRGLETRSKLSATDAEYLRFVTTNYNAFGEVIASGSKNKTSHYSYDRRGQVTQVTEPSRQVSKTRYDAFGRKSAVTSTNGYTTRYQYNDQLRTTTMTSPEGVVTTTTVDQHGQVYTIEDGAGNITRYAYDENQVLVEKQVNGKRIAHNNLDFAGRVINAWDKNGTRVQFTYDAVGREASRTVDPDGYAITTRFVYDAKGQIIEQHHANGSVDRFRYDLMGRQTEITHESDDAPLSTTLLTYDADDKLIAKEEGHASGMRRVTHYAYDGRGNLITEALLVGDSRQVTHYAYDKDNNLGMITDAEGNKSFRVYDLSDRLVYEVDARGAVTETVYDRAGNIKATIAHDKLLDTRQFFAGMGRSYVSAELKNTAQQKTYYTYNKDNQVRLTLQSVTGSRLAITENRYDSAGRVMESIQYANTIPYHINRPDTLTTSVVMQHVTENPKADRKQHFIYDDLGHVQFTLNLLVQDGQERAVVMETQHRRGGKLAKSITYADTVAYNTGQSLEELQSALKQSGAVNNKDNRVTSYAYDNRGELARVTYALGQTETHLFNQVGDRIAFINKNGHRFEYEYDSQHRVIFEHSPEVKTLQYNGADGFESTTRKITKAYTYDALGQVKTITEDFGGPMAATTTFDYDAAGNTVAVTQANPGYWNVKEKKLSITPGQERITRTSYDALNREVVQQNALGDYSYTVYDAAGGVAYEVDEEGFVTEYQRDAFGQVTRLVRHNYALKLDQLEQEGWKRGSALNESQIKAGLETSIFNRTLTMRYDALGRKVSEKMDKVRTNSHASNEADYEASPEKRYTYNAFSEITQKSVLRAIDGDGTELWVHSRFFMDSLGQVRLIMDEQDFATVQSYDAMGNMIGRTEYAGVQSSLSAVLQQGQSSLTNLINRIETHATDRAYRFQFDTLGRQTHQHIDNVRYYKEGVDEQVATTGTITSVTEYDGMDNVIKAIDNEGNATSQVFDALNRKVKVLDVTRREYNNFLNPDASEKGVFIEVTPEHQWFYDARGNMVSEVHSPKDGVSDSRVVSHVYDFAGRKVRSLQIYKDFDGTERQKEMQYSYDALDRKIADIRYNDTQYQHWSSYRRDDQDRVTSYQYDKRGHVVLINHYSKDHTKNQKLHVNAFGEVEKRELYYDGKNGNKELEFFLYDNAGRLYASNEEDGVSKHYRYDLMGNKTRTFQNVDGKEGFINRYQHDNLGRVILHTKPESEYISSNQSELRTPKHSYSYDRWGNLTWRSDKRTRYEYNHNNKLIRETQHFVGVIKNDTLDASKLHANLDPNTDNTYALLDRLKSNYDEYVRELLTWDSIAPVKEYGYNSLGQQVVSIDANGNRHTKLLNEAGHVIVDINGEGEKNFYAYNGFGEQVAKHTGASAMNYMRYDGTGNVSQSGVVIQGDFQAKQSFRYNAFGERTHDITGDQEKASNTAYTKFNGHGEVIARRYANHDADQTIVYKGEANGRRVVTTTDANGNVTEVHSDYFNRHLRSYHKVKSGSTLVNVRILDSHYNDQGQLVGEVMRDGQSNILEEKRYSYYANGLLKGIDKGKFNKQLTEAHRKATHQYGRDDYMKQLNDKSGNWERIKRTRFQYNSWGLETTKKEQFIKTGYDANNQWVSHHYTGQDMQYLYDDHQRIFSVEDHAARSGDLRYFFYFYDAEGNKVGIGHRIENTQDWHYALYDYDKANRLVVNHGDLGFINEDKTRLGIVAGTGQNYPKNSAGFSSHRPGKSAAITYDTEGRRKEVKTFVGEYHHSNLIYNEFQIYRYTYNPYGQVETIEVKYEAEVTSSQPTGTNISSQHGANRSPHVVMDWVVVEQREYIPVNNTAKSMKLRSVTYYHDGYNGGLRFDSDKRGEALRRKEYQYLDDGKQFREVQLAWENGYRKGTRTGVQLNNKQQNGSWFRTVQTEQFEYDKMNQLNSSESTYYNFEKSGNDKFVYKTKTTHGRDYRGSYVDVKNDVKVLDVADGYTYKDVSLNQYYDAFNGLLISEHQVNDEVKTRYFDNSTAGQLLFTGLMPKGKNDANISIEDVFHHHQGQQVGKTDTARNVFLDPGFGSTEPAAIDSSTNYIVSKNDTLQSIARTVYGDAQLWYLIAEANGLTDASELKEGMTLRIPSVSSSVHANSETFTPFNPLSAAGNTVPQAMYVPPPPPKKWASFLSALVQAVVTTFVTTALSPLGPVGAFIGGAAGSIAGQGVLILAGEQSEIEWDRVAIAATSNLILNDVLGANVDSFGHAGMALTRNLVNYGVGKAISPEDTSWDNRSVLAAVGAAQLFSPLDADITGGDTGFQWAQVAYDATIDLGEVVVSTHISASLDRDSGLSWRDRMDWASAAGGAIGGAIGAEYQRSRRQALAVRRTEEVVRLTNTLGQKSRASLSDPLDSYQSNIPVYSLDSDAVDAKTEAQIVQRQEQQLQREVALLDNVNQNAGRLQRQAGVFNAQARQAQQARQSRSEYLGQMAENRGIVAAAQGSAGSESSLLTSAQKQSLEVYGQWRLPQIRQFDQWYNNLSPIERFANDSIVHTYEYAVDVAESLANPVRIGFMVGDMLADGADIRLAASLKNEKYNFEAKLYGGSDFDLAFSVKAGALSRAYGTGRLNPKANWSIHYRAKDLLDSETWGTTAIFEVDSNRPFGLVTPGIGKLKPLKLEATPGLRGNINTGEVRSSLNVKLEFPEFVSKFLGGWTPSVGIELRK